MRLLWISPRWPFPADDGAKQATASLTLALAEKGHEIDFISFSRDEVLPPSPHPRIHLRLHRRAASLALIPRAWLAVRNLAGSLPVSAATFTGFGLNWETMRALLPEEPGAVVFDGTHGYAAFLGKHCPWPILYRAHNNETSLWEQAAERARFKPYFLMQARRMREFESALGAVSAGVAAISPLDAEAFRKWFPNTPVEWVPMGFRFSAPAPLPRGPLTLGYLGRMDWPPNREGLAWFLEKVWPRVRDRRADVRLRIAGSGDASWLDRYSEFDFEHLGRIASLPSFYESIHASVVPVLYGSGTKIKLVEAASHGRAVFTTESALLGSGLKRENMVMVSDDPAQWAERISSCTGKDLEATGRAAFGEARSLFEAGAAADRFLSLLPKDRV